MKSKHWVSCMLPARDISKQFFYQSKPVGPYHLFTTLVFLFKYLYLLTAESLFPIVINSKIQWPTHMNFKSWGFLLKELGHPCYKEFHWDRHGRLWHNVGHIVLSFYTDFKVIIMIPLKVFLFTTIFRIVTAVLGNPYASIT